MRGRNFNSLQEEEVIKVVKRICPDSGVEITPETNFVNDLGLDSLDFVELIIELEKKFDINIPDNIAETILTVGQAADKIQTLLY